MSNKVYPPKKSKNIKLKLLKIRLILEVLFKLIFGKRVKYNFLCAISLELVILQSPKITSCFTFTKTMRSYTVKENHVGSAVSEIIWYRQIAKSSYYFYKKHMTCLYFELFLVYGTSSDSGPGSPSIQHVTERYGPNIFRDRATGEITIELHTFLIVLA